MAPERNDETLDNDLYNAALHPMSIESRVILLAERIKNLTKELQQIKTILEQNKIDLDKRLTKLEVTYQRVFGIILIFPFLGVVLGFIATYWTILFKPWAR